MSIIIYIVSQKKTAIDLNVVYQVFPQPVKQYAFKFEILHNKRASDTLENFQKWHWSKNLIQHHTPN